MAYAKAGIGQFRIRPEYEHESSESLIGGDLGIVATKSAEALQDGSSLAFLGLCKSWDRSVSCSAERRAGNEGSSGRWRSRY